MKWVKHDTDANQDAKLQNILLDYGLEGYGLYWYCIELIAGKVSKDNITFELEHDARIIARNTGSTPQKVEEMMRRFVELGLFENTEGVITCLKLARRLDKSMTSNPQMREIIGNFTSHDGVMTQSEKVMKDKIRLDKNNISNSHEKISRPKYKFTDEHMKFAKWFYERVRGVTPSLNKKSLDSWANTTRLMIESDKLELKKMAQVFKWANQDEFWSTNILSVDKFRKQYHQLEAKMNSSNGAVITQQAPRPQKKFKL